MTQEELIIYCTGGFYEDFAKTGAEIVLRDQSFDILWNSIKNVHSLNLPKPQMGKFMFRASYIFDHIYFSRKIPLDHIVDEIFGLFPTLTNGSMRRHFAKICYDLIEKGHRPPIIKEFCETCIDWTIDPKVRVAVKSRTIGILAQLAAENIWVRELVPDLLETLSRDNSPGVQSTLKWIARKGFKNY